MGRNPKSRQKKKETIMIKSILGDFDFTTEPVAMNINNGPVDNQSPHMTACVATLVENIY